MIITQYFFQDDNETGLCWFEQEKYVNLQYFSSICKFHATLTA